MTDPEDLLRANITIHERIDPEVRALVQRLRDRLDNGDTEEASGE
jgi:hypothetical protein